jgi:hypothetical protein
MAKCKIFNNLCKKALERLASSNIISGYIKSFYTRGLSPINFIKGIIKALNFAVVSTFTYKFSSKGTYRLYAITDFTPLPTLPHDLR